MRALKNAIVAAMATMFVAAAPAAAAPSPPYTVKFDSTEVNNFLGISAFDPQGTETTEYAAEVPLAAGSGGAFTGSAEGTYPQTSGGFTEECQVNNTTGTTTEVENSGNPYTVAASLTPAANGVGGNLTLTFGAITPSGLQEPTENFTATSTCGPPPPEPPTPRWLGDFTKEHKSQVSLSNAFTFVLPLTAGSGNTAGTYTFSGQFTDTNLNSTESTTITVTYTPCVVPSVVNESQASATSDLEDAGCTVGAVTQQQSKTVAVGNVISSSPAAGAQLQPLAPVSLVVSSGSKVKLKCVVPKLKGQPQAAAEKALTAANCAVGNVTKKSSTKVAAGDVISTNPKAGATKAAGTKVNLVVSNGAACKVPKLKHLKLAKAKKKLKAAHCGVGKITKKKSTKKNKGRVIKQKPAAGAVKPKGAKVKLTVGK